MKTKHRGQTEIPCTHSCQTSRGKPRRLQSTTPLERVKLCTIPLSVVQSCCARQRTCSNLYHISYMQTARQYLKQARSRGQTIQDTLLPAHGRDHLLVSQSRPGNAFPNGSSVYPRMRQSILLKLPRGKLTA